MVMENLDGLMDLHIEEATLRVQDKAMVNILTEKIQVFQKVLGEKVP